MAICTKTAELRSMVVGYFRDNLSKAEASKLIDEMREKAGVGYCRKNQ